MVEIWDVYKHPSRDAIIYFEDFQETCKRLEPNSIDLVVTSPPYCVEKIYERELQWTEYQELLWWVYTDMMRILIPGGYFVINFGDQARGRAILGTETHTTIPMSAVHWEIGSAVGLELQATRIWRKKFARMGIPFVCNHFPRPVYDYEHIWTWRKPDGTGKEIVRDRKLSQRGVLEFEDDHPLKRYTAAFPLGLPRWAISVYSDENDLVYDPFVGSGTTGLAAIQLKRKFIGSEINKELEPIIKEVIERQWQSGQS